jgi:hypothetical protein
MSNQMSQSLDIEQVSPHEGIKNDLGVELQDGLSRSKLATTSAQHPFG